MSGVRAEVYLLLSCCPCEGRLSGIVDVPNACATLAIPIAIFDQVRLLCAGGCTCHQSPSPVDTEAGSCMHALTP